MALDKAGMLQLDKNVQQELEWDALRMRELFCLQSGSAGGR
jgi:hypothetical protein